MIWAIALAVSPADWTKLPAGAKPAVEDTYLDQTSADSNYGRSEILVSGLAKTVLIRPTDLAVRVGPGERIAEASLLLTTSEPISPEITDVGLIETPWFEGAGRAQGLVPQGDLGRWSATWNNSRAGEGGVRWNRGGAMGDSDREPIPGLTTTFELGALQINGLGPALQLMLDNPGKYTGIAFTTKGRAQFLSSEFGAFGPVFNIKTEASPKSDGPDLEVIEISPSAPMRTAFPGEGQPLSWEARIKNVGSKDSSASTGQWQLRWSDMGSASIPGLKPGEEVVVKIDANFKDQPDKRFWPMSFRVDAAGDVNPRNNIGEIHVGAIPVAVVEGGQPAGPESQAAFRHLVDLMNTRVFPMSRFGFAPEGLTERLRFVSDPSRAMVTVEGSTLDAAPVKGLVAALLNLPSGFFAPPSPAEPNSERVGITEDTRDEWAYPGGTAYPEHLWPPVIFGQPMMPESGLLGRTESAMLTALAGKSGEDRNLTRLTVPSVLILRSFDGGGRAIKGAKVSVYQPVGAELGTPIYTTETDRVGTVLLMPKLFTDKRNTFFGDLSPDGSNSWLYIEYESQGEKTGRWLSWAQLLEEAKRGATAASSLEYRMMLSDQPIDRKQNLVKGRSVEDSLGRFPAELTAVLDEDPGTSAAFPGEGTWVEFDLGRDRAIGEVDLVFDGDVPWENFIILVYNTSQTPDAARPWIEENFGSMRANVQGGAKDGHVRVRYTGGSTNARYFRILKLKGDAKLTDVYIRPVVGG